jgi:hypothetical protein
MRIPVVCDPPLPETVSPGRQASRRWRARQALEGASFDAPAAAGTYFFVRGGRRVGALVVNAEVDESRLDRWSAGDLAERVSTAHARVVTARDEWTRLAFSGTARRSLVLPLLVIALLVLAAEAVISTTGGRAQQ